MSKIEHHTVVTLHYTLRNDGGRILDTSSDGPPLEYLHGVGSIVPGLEKALGGKAKGEKLKVVVAPEDAYGPRDPAGRQDVPRDELPDEIDLRPGAQLIVEDETGEERPVWVLQANAETVTLDLNHPLAGERLHFEVEVLDIRPATQDEIAHGHAHGAHGHGHDEDADD